MNQFMNLYKTLFSQNDATVESWIIDVQAVAREYSAEYNDPPLAISNTKLDDTINNLFGLDPALALSDLERESLVNLLVNYHDLQRLKPWGVVATGAPAPLRAW